MPHMGSDHMDESDEYADLMTQVAGLQATVPNSADVPGANIDAIRQLEPVSERGIDSDELAELVAMRVSFDSKVFQNDSPQTETGFVEFEADVGFNLQNSELPSQAGNNSPTAESEDQGDGNVVRFNYEEPGILYTNRDVEYVGFNEVNGAGAGSAAEKTDELMINFRNEFGSGPFVDRTDDLTLSVETNHDNVIYGSQAKVTFIGYWDTFEVPDGRASFARP